MKRSGFTMIELIFVIVILGILAAVALPKFLSVSDSATVGKLTGYAGTMSRTTLASKWKAAPLTDPDMADAYANLTPPEGTEKVGGGTPTVYTAAMLEAAGFDFTNNTANTAVNTSGPVNGLLQYTDGSGNVFVVACSQGSQTEVPDCNVYDTVNNKWLIDISGL